MDGLVTKNTVSIDFSADKWELYDKKGRDVAAKNLSASLQRAINAPGSTPSSVRKDMDAACSKYSNLGASDSEAYHLIEKVIEKVYD